MTGAGRKLVLSIETAVGGGSLSLLSNEEELGGWNGRQEISKAENVLEQISNLLKAKRVGEGEIKLIVVSKGAGSLTGEKIGLAIGKGLAKSLNCRLSEVSVLESLLIETAVGTEGKYLTAVPSGRSRVQWQEFAFNDGLLTSETSSQTFERTAFAKRLETPDFDGAILAVGFGSDIQDFGNPRVILSQNSLAKLNGISAARIRQSNSKHDSI